MDELVRCVGWERPSIGCAYNVRDGVDGGRSAIYQGGCKIDLRRERNEREHGRMEGWEHGRMGAWEHGDIQETGSGGGGGGTVYVMVSEEEIDRGP